MPPGVFVLVLVVAVLHVAWNALLKTSGDTLRTAERAMIVGVAVFAPFVVIGWFATGRPGLEPQTVALAVVSGILEAAYFICLAEAYRRGDLSVVYPIARGTAPVLSVALGVTVLGERLEPAGRRRGRRPARRDPARPAAVAGRGGRPGPPGSLARRRGARPVGGLARRCGRVRDAHRRDDRGLFSGRLRRSEAGAGLAVRGRRVPGLRVALVAWVRLVARRPGRTEHGSEGKGPAPWIRSGAAGTISLGAYGLILIAYTLAPLTAIAPLRESSVVIASAWGAIRMGEAVDARDRARRLSGAGLVLVGAVLLALKG